MYITALDFGSSQIKGLLAEIKKDNSLHIIKSFKNKSFGIKKGEIVYPEETVRVIFEIINEIKNLDKKCLKSVICGISGTKSRLNISKAVISIPHPNFEILREDVERVIRDSLAINLPTGWQIMHSIPREFIIDDIEVSDSNVIGLSGKKLEANVIVVSVFSLIYKNFKKVVELVFGKKDDFGGALIFSPLACERSILTRHQKELGVVMIDLGAETTSIIVYQDNKLVSLKVFPFGSENITNDLALGLKCSIDTANEIKLSFGAALARDVSSKEKVDLSQFGNEPNATIAKKYIAEIIESRSREIFATVGDELKRIGLAGKLPAGVVITGGGSKMPGIADLAREELRLPVQIGVPNLEGFEFYDSSLSHEVEDPEMSVVAGLILNRLDILRKKIGPLGIPERGTANFGDSFIKKIFKILIPSD